MVITSIRGRRAPILPRSYMHTLLHISQHYLHCTATEHSTATHAPADLPRSTAIVSHSHQLAEDRASCSLPAFSLLKYPSSSPSDTVATPQSNKTHALSQTGLWQTNGPNAAQPQAQAQSKASKARPKVAPIAPARVLPRRARVWTDAFSLTLLSSGLFCLFFFSVTPELRNHERGQEPARHV